MPKVHNTVKEKKQELYDRLTPARLLSDGGILDIFPGDSTQPTPLTKEQKAYIRAQYARFHNSWLDYDLRRFLFNEK